MPVHLRISQLKNLQNGNSAAATNLQAYCSFVTVAEANEEFHKSSSVHGRK